MINVEEKYSLIIKSGNSDQMIAFLKTLEEKTRLTLVALIKKDVRRLYTYKNLDGKRNWGYEGTSVQHDMLGVAMFCCYGRADHKKIDVNLVITNNIIDRILSWYCPEWFSAFINYSIASAQQRGYGFIDYEHLAEWLANGYLDARILTQESIAMTLPPPGESLEKYAFTLDKHIWLIFHYPPYLTQRWIESFKVYTKNQRLDRYRVLKESLMAVNRNFNKHQTNGFATLFSALEPTTDECLSLQDELFAALNCPQSKPVNTALQRVKKLVKHPDFRADEFITQLQLLLSSTTKGIVNTSLAMADTLALQKADKRKEICLYLTGVFLNKDASLQNKAAKLLVKYGDPTDVELSALLMSYADHLLSDASQILTDFLDARPGITGVEEEIADVLPLIREDNRIPDIANWDDFIFLAGRAFLNHESYHFDQFPAALLRFANEINEDNVTQLEPAFAQAWKTIGMALSFDGMLASFFLQYASELLARFPAQTQKIRPFYEKHQHVSQMKGRFQQISWGIFASLEQSMARCRPYIELLSWVLSGLKNNICLPLLSTPTHLPCFIDPVTLVERLYQYQQAGIPPCHQDLQLALQRCVISAEAPSLGKLNGEYRALMNYFLSGDLTALVQMKDGDWKLTAIITRRAVAQEADSALIATALLEKKALPSALLTCHFPWQIKQQTHQYSGGQIINRTLCFDISNGWQQADITLFYAHGFMHCPDQGSDWGVDKRRTIFSCPWLYDLTLMRFTEMNFRSADIAAVKSNLEILQALYDLPLPLTAMAHLFTALCLLHADKTVRMLAAELWIDKMRYPGGVNAFLLGDTLGKLEAGGWAPLKRFTDLAMQSMLGISSRHNAALREMVEVMDAHLKGIKITNYKKLTVLYGELTRSA